jgi:phage shock protein C
MLDTATRPVARTRKKESLIGVCQAVGDDFGFNPDFLRVALAMLMLVNAEATLAVYVTAGLLVLVSRLLVRDARAPAVSRP